MQLAADTGEPGLIAATLETDPSRLRMLGKVVIKSMDGTASTITTTPGRIRISELKEKAISEHPRLQGLRPEAFELVSVESPNASTTGVKLTDRFDPVVTQSFRVHDKAAQEVACANADCFDCLLFGACRNVNNGGGKVRCCGDMCCHPLCIPFLPILRHPILTFSYEREAGDANSLLGLSSSHAEKKALMEVLDERNATHGTLPVGVADAPSELIIVFNQGV
jgi:hypothetical protein